MKIFTEFVDRRSRRAMVEYLGNHFRYDTMNSWNNPTSYACNMKIYNLGLEQHTADKLYDLIQTDGFYHTISDLIYDFSAAHNFMWQAGFNGRSGGYLVLYRGGRKPSGYKSYCAGCGQKNYKSVTEIGNVCGRCGEPARMDFSQAHMSIHTFPGQSVDENENFEEWDMQSLRSRVELVQEFDALADAIAAEAVCTAENYEAREETIYVPQTRMVMAAI